MEVKKGYKMTDVGVIPKDWEVKQLGGITNISRGASPRPIDDPKWFDNQSTVGWVRISDITTVYKYLSETRQYLSKLGISNSKMLSNGNLIMSICATVGKPILTKIDICIHDGFVVLADPKIDKEYLFYFLIYIEKDWLKHGQTGSQMNLNTGLINSTNVYFPPTKAEQTAIANALSGADALIQSLEKLIAKKRLIKQGAMQKLLKPKEGWVVKKLGDFGATFGGLSGKSKKDFTDGNCPYIPFMNIMSNPVIDETYFDYVQINKGESHNKATKGDLFFNGSSETPEEVGMCSILFNDIPNLYLNSFCFGLRLFKTANENGLFLVYYFRSNEGRKHFRLLAQGATRYNLSKTQLLKMEIALPSVEEQTRIATILSDMDKEIDALETKLAKTKQLKQGLMQQLLTGKIRLV